MRRFDNRFAGGTGCLKIRGLLDSRQVDAPINILAQSIARKRFILFTLSHCSPTVEWRLADASSNETESSVMLTPMTDSCHDEFLTISAEFLALARAIKRAVPSRS